MSESDEHERKAAWEKHYAARLSERECPYSGLRLTRNGNAGPDSLSCWVCDCFGFDPDDKRIPQGGQDK